MKYAMATVLASSFLFAGHVFSHSGATGIIKERMDAMDEMSKVSKKVADMFNGKKTSLLDKLLK